MAQDRVSLASDVPPIQRGGTQCSQFFWTTSLCYVVFIAFNINHSGILPLMALNSLYCADVPLGNYSLTHSLGPPACTQTDRARLAKFGTVTLEAVAFFLGVSFTASRAPVKLSRPSGRSGTYTGLIGFKPRWLQGPKRGMSSHATDLSVYAKSTSCSSSSSAPG